MKKLALFLSTFALLASTSFAGDEKSTTYTGEITGVVCAACKAHVTAALTEKLPGIEKVDITKGDKEGVNKITIVAKQADVTKDTAMAALGTLATSYEITSLEKK